MLHTSHQSLHSSLQHCSACPVLKTLSPVHVTVLALMCVLGRVFYISYWLAGTAARVQVCKYSLNCQLPGKRILWDATGDPSRTDVAEEDMEWTIKCDDLTTVTAFPLPGSTAALGYVTRESDKCALS